MNAERVRAAVDRSRLVQTSRSAIGSSRLATGIRATVEGSTASTRGRTLLGTFEAWIRASWVGGALLELETPAEGAADGALVPTVVGSAIRAVESSWIHGWLTAEPEPEVVAIDLRDTRSVGPFVALTDPVLERLRPAGSCSVPVRASERALAAFGNAPVRALGYVVLGAVLSGTALGVATGAAGGSLLVLALVAGVLAGIGTRVGIGSDELLETAPVRPLVKLLEPSEPPAENDRRAVTDAPSDRGADPERPEQERSEDRGDAAERDRPE